jgi:phosphoglycolate phosphatase-like HAD superfamily hydrolase
MVEWMTPRAVFVDLDSTLCDTRHRWHMIVQGDDRDTATDWVAYAMACADDAPVWPAIQLVNLLAHGCAIVVLTGRSEDARALTETWLESHDVAYDDLIMRHPEWRVGVSNAVFKREMVTEWCSRHPGIEPALMIDDYVPVRDELDQIGVPTLVVTPAYDGESSLFRSV